MNLPRLVFLANNIDEVGGAQRVVHVLAQGLATRGYDVQLVGVTPFAPRHHFVEDPCYSSAVLMDEPWPAPSPQTKATRGLLRAQAIERLATLLADGEPGIVITAQLWAMEHLAQVPHDTWRVIGQYHSSFAAAAQGRDLARALASYADVDAFTLLTPADADDFRQQGLNNTRWMPNPLAFWPEHPLSSRARQVTYVGRFSSEKGVGYLLDAWALVAARHPDWNLRLVGAGPEEETLRAHLAALEGSHGPLRAQFAPPVTDVAAEYATTGILVLPSLTEGLPLVLAEGMASGLACVASDCSPGVRLLARDGMAARLAARGDAHSLADAIDGLIADDTERTRLGAKAREAMYPYRLDAVLDRWETLIAQVLR